MTVDNPNDRYAQQRAVLQEARESGRPGQQGVPQGQPVQHAPVQGAPIQGHPPNAQQNYYQQQQPPVQSQPCYPPGQIPQQVIVQVPPSQRPQAQEQQQPLVQGQQTTHRPPPNYGAATGTGQDPNNPAQGLVPTTEDRFPAKTGWVDVWWIPIFIIHTGAFLGLVAWQAYEAFQEPTDPFSTIPGGYSLHAWQVIVFLGVALLVGTLIGQLFLVLAKTCAKGIMWLSVGIQMVWGLVILIFACMEGNIVGIIVGVLFLVMFALFAYFMRHSIALAAALVGGAARGIQKNWGIQLMSIAYVGIEIFLYGVAFCWLTAILVKSNAEAYGFITFLAVWGLFAFYWMRNTFCNVMHVTYCGSLARYFYMGENQPENPTIISAKLAWSKYFGASSFGAFIMAVIQWLKAMAEMAKNDAQKKGNICTLILACICICILNCMERIFKIVNDFALVYVSIYGNNFWTSGKMVWKLCKATNLEPLFNDSALGLFSWCCAFLSFLLSGAILTAFSYAVFDEMNIVRMIQESDSTNFPVFVAIIYVMAMILCAGLVCAILQPIDSGARTLLVIFMEAPAYFHVNHPQVYAKVRDRAAKLGLVDVAPAYFRYN